MASLSERERNNIRAGVFVSVSLVAALAVLITLTDVVNTVFQSTEVYTVTFDVSSGVENLKKGSDVRVGGVRMGRVTKVTPDLKPGQAFRRIAVEFKLDNQVILYSNARVLVTKPLIGNEAWLDIPNVGDAKERVPSGGQIVGTPSIGMLTTILGSENAAKANEVVDNVKQFSSLLAEMDNEYATRVVPVLDNINSVTGDAKAVMSEFREKHLPNWTAAVDHVMTWATEATAKLDVALADGQGMLAEGRAVVTENRPAIKSTIDSVNAATTRFNTETIDKFHGLLESAQTGLDSANSDLSMLRDDYPMWSSHFGETMVNASHASQQLKLAAIETRRAPWKLLYRPTSEEVQHELLYDSTRAFAVATGELKATTEAVRRILDNHGNAVATNQELYRRLEKNLADALANYERAQQEMLDVLVSDGKK